MATTKLLSGELIDADTFVSRGVAEIAEEKH